MDDQAQTLPTFEELVSDDPGFLDSAVDPKEASRITNTPEATLSTLRCRGGGPKFLKRGQAVSYTRRACFEWLRAQERRNTSDTNGTVAT